MSDGARDGPPRARWRGELRARLLPLGLAPAREAEIVDELADHLDDHWRELIAGGAAEDEATRLTLAEFRSGNLLARYMAPLRQANQPPAPTPGTTTGRLLADAAQDLRYAVRTFVRSPGFAAAAVVTLAIAIGANSALFSVVRAVLLESLPFEAADRLYRIRMIQPDGSAYTTLSAPDFMSVREGTRVFERVEAYTVGAVTMLGHGDAEEVRVASVSDGLFEMLGLRVAAGRGFLAEEHAAGRRGVAVLDHGFWQRAFGGDAGALGRTVTIGGGSYTIVGVLAQGARLPDDVPGARLPADADAYLPIEYTGRFNGAAAEGRSSRYLGVLARAVPGAGPARIDEDLRRLGGALQAAFPDSNGGLSMDAITAQELLVGDVRTPLLMLLGAVGFVLLVACANVASLMLARGSARGDEIAVRVALGAGRGRLLRQLLTEALVVGVAGGAAGLVLAQMGVRALVAAQPADIPRLDDIRVDGFVMFFTLAVALAASLVCGTAPALQAAGSLTDLRGGGADRHTQRVRAGLIVTEIALAVVLLTGAGLLFRSLTAMTRVAPGFVAEQAIAFRVALFGRAYDLAAVRARVRASEAGLRALPGVTSAAATSLLPLSGPGQRLLFSVEGAPPPPSDVNPEIGVVIVTPDYFSTIGARLVRGRPFTDGDREDAPRVAIVNESAARRWFAGDEPVGRRIQLGESRAIVGVVADVLQGDPTAAAAPQLFLPFAQQPARFVWFVVRTAGDPRALASSIRSAIGRQDTTLAVSGLTRLEDLKSGSVARPRFYTTLLALFAAVALALAATGIFGVMSYTVAERTREIGIRMALGARAADVLRMIVGRTITLALLGVAAGLGGALALGRVIRGQLFGVDLLDPPTMAAVAGVLLTSAAAAAWVPARRAARLDPAVTLRQG